MINVGTMIASAIFIVPATVLANVHTTGLSILAWVVGGIISLLGALSVAELSARLDLPVGVVRVLIGDLMQANLISTFEADAAIRAPDDDILQAVIDGLRAL